MAIQSELPKEVINLIFRKLDEGPRNWGSHHRRTFSQCALTCRSWREVAQERLFSKISLTSVANFAKIQNSVLSSNRKLGELVRGLNIDPRGCGTSLLLSVAALFPRIVKLSFDSTSAINNDGDDFYMVFSILVTDHERFKFLQQLPTPKNKMQDDLYLKCLNALNKENIKFIELYELNNNCRSHVNRDLFTTVCNNNSLQQFTKMKSLWIDIATIGTASLPHYVEPLTKLNIKSFDNLIIDLNIDSSAVLKLSKRDIDQIQPMTEIKALRISISHWKEPYFIEGLMVYYVMKKFPNLRYLDITNNLRSAKGLIPRSMDLIKARQPADITEQFLKYAAKIPNCNVENTIILYEDMPSTIRDIFTFSSGLENSSSVRPSNHLFVNSGILHERNESTILDNIDDPYLVALINFKKLSKPKTKTVKVLLHKYDGFAFFLRQRHIIKMAGNVLDVLSVEVMKSSELVILLNYIAKNCDNLIDLTVTGFKLGLDLNVMEEAEKKHYHLKKLVLKDCITSTNHFKSIANQFPCLERLFIENDFVEWCKITGESTYSIHMPNTKFKYLEIDLKKDENTADDNYIKGHCFELRTKDDSEPKRCILRFDTSSLVLHLKKSPQESDYEKSSQREGVINFKICCESVDALVIRYNPSNRVTKEFDLVTVYKDSYGHPKSISI